MSNIKEIKTGLLAALIAIAVSVNGQDVHLSQFYASPATLNPAMTGTMSEVFRFSGSYRTQWSAVVPYSTYASSFERSININSNDKGGVGMTMLNDKTGKNSGLNMFRFLLSGAYSKCIRGKKGDMIMGIGGQAGYVQKSFYGDFVMPVAGTSVVSANDAISYLEFNMGFVSAYSFRRGGSAFIGGSVFHLNRPEESFFTNSGSNQLNRRWVLHGGLKHESKNSPFAITPNFVLMFMGGAKEINLGANIHYDFSKTSQTDFELIVGGWNRLNDALIVYAGLRFDSYELGFSYDFNTSPLKTSLNGRGALEFNFKYLFKSKSLRLCPFEGLRI
jgi:type IX secretion system PorP/SprF family membrane protein